MIYKIVFLNFFKNSQESTCDKVLFLMKFLAEKFLKIHKKTPAAEVQF